MKTAAEENLAKRLNRMEARRAKNLAAFSAKMGAVTPFVPSGAAPDPTGFDLPKFLGEEEFWLELSRRCLDARAAQRQALRKET